MYCVIQVFGCCQSYAKIQILCDLHLQSLTCLGDLVIKVAEFGLPDWMGRVKLIDCIGTFVLLTPQIGQVIAIRNIHYIWS